VFKYTANFIAYVLRLCILELGLKLGLGYTIWAWYVLAEQALLVLGTREIHSPIELC